MITWDKIVKAVAGAAGAVWGLFGGRDTMLTVMLALMAIDYGTGLLIGWMGKSPKTDSGHLSSSVGWAGLAKKAGELLAEHTPVSDADGVLCYELSREDYDALLAALADNGVTPEPDEESAASDGAMADGFALVYVADEWPENAE